MEAMTSKERLVAALEGQPVDRVPWSPFLAYVWEHFPKEVQDRGQLAFLKEVGADPLWRGAACPVWFASPDTVKTETVQEAGGARQLISTPVGDLNLRWKYSPDGNTQFLVEHPLKTEEDYKIQLWLEEHYTPTYAPKGVEEHLQGDGREGLSLGMLVPRCKTAYQHLVEHLAGTQELIYALCDFPETVEALHQAMVENDVKAVKLAARADYDYFLTWEDTSTQNYSPDQYNRYIASEIEQWCAILRENGKKYIQHACGHVRHVLPDMVRTGVHAVESLSPPPTGNIPLKEARAMVGDAFGIVGGIEPTHFLQLSMEELGDYVEQVLEDGSGGPFVLANSDSCPPGVTKEKFALVGNIVRQWKV